MKTFVGVFFTLNGVARITNFRQRYKTEAIVNMDIQDTLPKCKLDNFSSELYFSLIIYRYYIQYNIFTFQLNSIVGIVQQTCQPTNEQTTAKGSIFYYNGIS